MLSLAGTSVVGPWASRNPVDPATSLFLKFQPGTPTADVQATLDAVGGRVVEEFPDGPRLVELAPWLDRAGAISSFESDASVAYAEANQSVRADFAPLKPSDPKYAQQWGPALIDAPYAWALHSRVAPGSVTTKVITQGRKKVTVTVPAGPATVQLSNPSTLVAVIDTGIDLTNPDFAGRLWVNPAASTRGRTVYGWNFLSNNGFTQDDNGHGTHVSGIIAAAGNNGVGVVGIDWNARIMPLKTLDAFGDGSLDVAAKAVYFAAANGAKVINASWGGDTYSQTLRDAINYANARGAVFVTAAGNDSLNNDAFQSFPANYRAPNELVVAAVDPNGTLSSYSNFGPRTVDLAAPGTTIVSTVPGGYAAYTGTSMATPFVTGTVSLLASLNPGLSAAQLVARVRATVKPLPGLAGKVITGGVVDPFFAVVNHRTRPG